MASAASPPPSGDRPRTRGFTPFSIAVIGNGMPMSPVEQTNTSSTAQPSSPATSAHMRSASSWPGLPVAALALPLLSTTAAARPHVAPRWARLTNTGAAVARFEVNTAAALTGDASSVATSARSGTPPALIPQCTPAATNPAAAVTLTRTPPAEPATEPVGGWPVGRAPSGRGPEGEDPGREGP